jgi:hypothetical protein
MLERGQSKYRRGTSCRPLDSEHGVLRDQRKQPLMRGRGSSPRCDLDARRTGRVAVIELGVETERRNRSAIRRNWYPPRTPHPTLLNPGDVLDFWRVLLADRVAGRLILYAEMKVPGEAWLEFQVSAGELVQTATFRPRGLYGRAYWYLCFPFHF